MTHGRSPGSPWTSTVGTTSPGDGHRSADSDPELRGPRLRRRPDIPERPKTVDPIRAICSRTCSGYMPGSCTRKLSASAPTSFAVRREFAPPSRPADRTRSSGRHRTSSLARRSSRRPPSGRRPARTRKRPSHTRRIRTLAPVPRASSNARVRRASRGGADMPSIRIPAPHRAARTAAATDTAALSTGTGARRQARSAGSPSSCPSSSPWSIATSRGSSDLKRATESV